MIHSSRLRRLLAAAMVAAIALGATPARALKVATWNLLAYPQDSLSFRQPKMRTILAALDPDVLLVQEMDFIEGRDSLLHNVLNVIQPGQWTGSWVRVGQGTGAASNQGHAVFWKPAKVAISNIAVNNVPIAAAWPRSTMIGLVKPVGYAKNGAWFRFYNFHLKASTADTASRRAECNSLRAILNTQNTSIVGTNFLICGDANFYSAFEGGYIGLTQSQSDNDGRAFDPLVMPGNWNSNPAYAANFTQCPCLTGCWSAQSGGGLDDRFDLLLTSASMQDVVGLDVVPGSTTAFGNDGLHFNGDINAGGNAAVPADVANALHDASDHLPVVFTLQLPAKYGVASQLAFGDVIVGATPAQDLGVSNVAPAPAEVLAYSLSASAGFSAPPGPFNASAGAAANVHSVGMDASSVGERSGTLTLASNDNDTTSKAILLSGRVLAHAVPSLDSLTQVLAGTLDFGSHAAGQFADGDVRMHDAGYGPLQARLAVTAATITGDPRFSLAGGFSPVTFGSPGNTWSVHFDDVGAPADSSYAATLTFSTADEAVPGATVLVPISVSLTARVLSGGAGVGEPGLALRFLAPRPNPARSGAELAYELPRPARVALGVYDLGGRRVATLVDGTVGQGHHALRWNAQDDAGRPVPAGLYFVRFQTPGLTRVSRLAILP